MVTIKRYRLFTLLFAFCLLFSIRAFATQDDVRNNVVYRWDYNSISDFSELSNYVYYDIDGKDGCRPSVENVGDGGYALKIKHFRANKFTTPTLIPGVYTLSFKIKTSENVAADAGLPFEIFFNPSSPGSWFMESEQLKIISNNLKNNLSSDKNERKRYYLKNHVNDWTDIKVQFCVDKFGVRDF